MKTCSSCNRSNPDDMNFCLDCGVPLGTGLEEVPTVVSNAPPTVVISSPVTQEMEPKKRHPVRWIVTGLIALIVLPIVLFFVVAISYKMITGNPILGNMAVRGR